MKHPNRTLLLLFTSMLAVTVFCMSYIVVVYYSNPVTDYYTAKLVCTTVFNLIYISIAVNRMINIIKR